jgi:hypothetical protein
MEDNRACIDLSYFYRSALPYYCHISHLVHTLRDTYSLSIQPNYYPANS